MRLQGQVTEIGSWAFEGCGRLKTVTGTEHLRRVGDYAFSDCQAVTFAFPAQLEVAGENAFYFCRQLQIGALPQSIKSIGKRAFAYCPGKRRQCTQNPDKKRAHATSYRSLPINRPLLYNVWPIPSSHRVQFENCNEKLGML